jgi:hypothetical protein
MKLTHLSEVNKAIKPQIQPKRNPFSSFKLGIGSLALLSAFTFGSMAFPGHIAAQPVKTAAESPFDTVRKSPHFSFLRIRGLGGYAANPIREMRNVPLVIRTVSENLNGTDDPITSSTVSFPSGIYLGLFGLDLNVGPGVYFYKDRFAVEVGVGAELPLIIFSDKHKRTIEEHTYSPYYYRSWYDVAPAITLGPSLYLKPYLSAEVKTRISSWCIAGLGYTMSKEDFVARNGTEGSAGYGDPKGTLKVYNEFDLVDMTVGMPYAFFGYYTPETGMVHVYFGFRHILTEKLSDLARQGEFVYRDFALAIGVRCGNLAFPRAW